ncbi:PfkB family carbohydrate kinase, partial [Streptomyces sp. NPDC059593]|uniref:PfkB family carbohydrate kinase n=1 Tax=Streptomyces sp. NPDC059593 TaxID=3346878 RepID=UPI00369C94A5
GGGGWAGWRAPCPHTPTHPPPRAPPPPPHPRASHAGGAGLGGSPFQPPVADTVTSAPAPRVDVVSAVGAGDAFAAGFLSATLRDLPVRARLRHGHLMAAAALTVPGDVAVPPRRAHADRLAALDASVWETLHLGPGWTGDDQEVRTP